MPETFAEEVERLKREIAERQMRLQFLVLGDPSKSVSAQAKLDALNPNYNRSCSHKHWSFAKHGRVCTCGAWMVDFGD